MARDDSSGGSALVAFVCGIVVAAMLTLAGAWLFRAAIWGPPRIDTSRPTVVREIRQLARLETVVFGMDKIVSGGWDSRYLPKALAGDRLTLDRITALVSVTQIGRARAEADDARRSAAPDHRQARASTHGSRDAVPSREALRGDGLPGARTAASQWGKDRVDSAEQAEARIVDHDRGFEPARRKLRDQHLQARLVSFSVDPSHDTPEVLRAYATSYHYDPAHWSFLTGPSDKIAELARLCDVKFEADSGFFNHNFRTLIIDASNRLQMVFPTSGDLSDAIVQELLKGAGATNPSTQRLTSPMRSASLPSMNSEVSR
jgi:hypothetical protein